MSVYSEDEVSFVKEAIGSLYAQSIQADIYIQQDGPVSEELEAYLIHEYRKGYITYLGKREENIGLAMSLNELLMKIPSSYNLIARMDADDIALPNRFEIQSRFLYENPQIDIVGGWICEFDTRITECKKVRQTPLMHTDIEHFATYRNPMNHVTVMFRREVVKAVGGYRRMNGFEDYDLWIRMLMKGSIFANIPQILVKVRTGRGMLTRRCGLQYFKDEWYFEKEVYRLGFWSLTDLIKNFFMRMLPRLLPVFVVEKLYNLLRK